MINSIQENVGFCFHKLLNGMQKLDSDSHKWSVFLWLDWAIAKGLHEEFSKMFHIISALEYNPIKVNPNHIGLEVSGLVYIKEMLYFNLQLNFSRN